MQPLVSHSHALRFCAGLNHLPHALAGRSFVLTRGGQRAVDGVIVRACDEKIFGGKSRDYFVARFRDHNFLFDTGRTPTVRRWPESLERKHHPRLDFMRMLE